MGLALAGRRIGGPGGGSDKGSKGGGLVIAIAVAVVLGAGGVAGGSALSSGGATAGAGSGARSGSGATSRNIDNVQVRLTSTGVRITGRIVDDAADCAAHSYGQVREFFRAHPCFSLRRAQFEVRDRNGDVALVPIAWVEMPTDAEARQLKMLMDTGGTGNVTELSRERGRYRTIRYTGDAYASRRDGTTVVNAQAQPVARGWAGLALTSVVTNAVE